MKLSTHFRCLFLALCMVAMAACNASPTSPADLQVGVSGRVLDDRRELFGAGGLSVPVEGVRVEVLQGAEKGRFVITGPDGQFDLGLLTSGVLVGATKEGWEPADPMYFYANVIRDSIFYVSQAPHVLWGTVSGPGKSVVDGARVELFDGPNAGKVTFSEAHTGRFQFDDLVTSSAFWIEFSKPGYQTVRFQIGELRSNYQYQCFQCVKRQ